MTYVLCFMSQKVPVISLMSLHEFHRRSHSKLKDQSLQSKDQRSQYDLMISSCFKHKLLNSDFISGHCASQVKPS